jgi:hydroxyacylglutathione hydrolase
MTEAGAPRLTVAQFPCLSNNYGFLVRDEAAGLTAAIDTPDAKVIASVCEKRGWQLTHIFNTHHHADHAGGNLELKQRYACKIIGAEADRHRIPGMDVGVSGGERFQFGSKEVTVLNVPGHTTGHIAFVVESDGMAFVGDALFVLGCGRLFEGTAAQAKASLEGLAALPPETLVFCAHEYSQTNARYALTVDPSNEALVRRAAEIDKARAAELPTVPTTIKLELETNPFLRPHTPSIRATLGMPQATDLEVFTELRKRRDKW